jgi:hypothetical protein
MHTYGTDLLLHMCYIYAHVYVRYVLVDVNVQYTYVNLHCTYVTLLHIHNCYYVDVGQDKCTSLLQKHQSLLCTMILVNCIEI